MSDDILKDIQTKVNKISDDMTDIKITSAKQQVSLDEHVRRTELLEKGQEILFGEMVPIKAHINQMSGVLKFLGILGSVATFVLGCLKLLGRI